MSWNCMKRLSMRGDSADIDALVGDLPHWPKKGHVKHDPEDVKFFSHHVPAPADLEKEELEHWMEENWAGTDPDGSMKVTRLDETYAEVSGHTSHSEAFPTRMLEALSAKFPRVRFFWEWHTSDGFPQDGCALLWQGGVREALQIESTLTRFGWENHDCESRVFFFEDSIDNYRHGDISADLVGTTFSNWDLGESELQ